MSSLDRRISRLRSLRAIQDAGRGIRLPASAIVFEQPPSVVDAVYRRPGTGLYLCLHGKPYVIPCRSCKRSEANANENFLVLVDSIKRKSLAEIEIT
jgi:hypothetical protein